MAEIISTSLVYPNYEQREGVILQPETETIQRQLRFNQFMHTHIRKQYNGIWYLIPVIMRSENLLMPDRYEEQQKAQFRRDIEMQFHTECYKALLFYEIENSIRMQILPYGRPPIFQDADQRSEKERLGINIK